MLLPLVYGYISQVNSVYLISHLLGTAASKKPSAKGKLAQKRRSGSDEEDSDDFQDARIRGRETATHDTGYNEDEEDSSCLCNRGYEDVCLPKESSFIVLVKLFAQ